jgi:hypothetical protein
MNARKMTIWRCDVCGTGHLDQDGGEKCCQIHTCQDCGRVINPRTEGSYVECHECRGARHDRAVRERFKSDIEKALEVEWKDEDFRMVYHPDGENDGYMCDAGLDLWLEEASTEYLRYLLKSPYVFATVPFGHGVTPDSIVEYVVECVRNGEHHEDADDGVVDMTPEEKAVVQGWLDRCKVESWKIDRTRRVCIRAWVENALSERDASEVVG